MENFEKATKQKLRFNTTKGLLSVEDLWDLSLTSLDSIARSVNKALKEESEESFIAVKTAANTTQQLRLDILKYIIEVKLKEKEVAKTRAEKSAKIETLKALAASKEIEELGAKSLDDIQKMIAELETTEE